MSLSWDNFLHPYELTVKELKLKLEGIREQYKINEQHSPIESVRIRVKTISSILEKCNKRNIPLSDIENQMYDIAGIRINCQFVEDIFSVVELLKNRSDIIIIRDIDLVSTPKESGYKSYHLHGYYLLETINGTKNVLFEIQIRTMAMNFWATIEHSLNYKYDYEVPQEIQDRMKRAAEAAAQLDSEMSKIKNQIEEAQRQFKYKQTKHLDIDKINL